ncbi:MAG TPA: FadR/GntR family transcriptional regulator [Acidobacteriaceae bacterium]|jgi:GntR family transcriptional repressor for pyruvate dehydrogenase complex|nr:FadR/GntR family transcriptional regulator [Acidobacteriaceae bacterium]
MSAEPASESGHPLVEQAIEYIRNAIEKHDLHPGDRLPAERELAQQLKISRATLRSAIGSLAAMGVLRIRHGVGTFVADGPPEIAQGSFDLLRALHGFQSWQMFEARTILERSLAALAAERGQESDFAALSEEVAEMYATCNDPNEYLIHDVLFHRLIARASGNPILAWLMETVVTALYEARRKTVEHAADLKESAEIHRAIYRAIRGRNGRRATELMEKHLKSAETAQASEPRGPAHGDASAAGDENRLGARRGREGMRAAR